LDWYTANAESKMVHNLREQQY